MSFRLVTDGADPGEKVLFQKADPKNGKPVYVFLGQVGADDKRELRREYARGVRTDKLAKRPAAETFERIDEAQVKRAMKALRGQGSENFSVEIPNAGTAADFSQALGREVGVGEEVVLDGLWNEGVKRLVCTHLPGFAERVLELEKKLARVSQEEEEEDTESFRS